MISLKRAENRYSPFLLAFSVFQLKFLARAKRNLPLCLVSPYNTLLLFFDLQHIFY